MRLALHEARKGLGRTSPNPAVGAVLFINGIIAATGHHRGAGLAHAEIECLRRFKKAIPKRAVLFVTLEPCSTAGRTGACTKAIVEAGVRNIVIGATDPNPQHAGRGIEILQQAGLNVRSGVLADECSALNEGYNKWITMRRPFVVAKCGMSLDGRLSPPSSEPRWITSPASRRHAQKLRAEMDAILIGAGTLRADNPRLTVRGIRGAKQPWRVVLSRSGSLPRQAHLFSDRFADRTIVFKGNNLETVLRKLGEREITSVLIEGGGEILGQALDGRLVDKVQLYLGPSFTGGPLAFAGDGVESTRDAPRLDRVSVERIGQDVCIRGYPTDRAITFE